MEGGKDTINMFIKNNCWDEARIIKNEKKLIKGVQSPKINFEPNNEFKINDDLVQIFFN